MKVTFYHNWDAYDYGFHVSGEKTKTILDIEYESTDSHIILCEIAGRDMYTIELWGGNGPSYNECQLIDSKKEALDSLIDFIERINDYVSDDEVELNQIKLEEIKSYLS